MGTSGSKASPEYKAALDIFSDDELKGIGVICKALYGNNIHGFSQHSLQVILLVSKCVMLPEWLYTVI